MDYQKKIITDLEIHSAEGIRECFENGISPDQSVNGNPLFDELVSGYLRSSNFKDCVKVFAESGLQFENRPLLAVLLDDFELLKKLIADNPEIISERHTLKCAFTPLENVSLLHICAEYNHLYCAEVLLNNNADVNAKAETDEFGFGGQTPVFHTVNQHNNICLETMKLLLKYHADLDITLKGIIWGKGYDWETYIPSVNPVGYAMMGLLPQFQRREKDIFENVEILMKEAYGIKYRPANIPNKYLRKKETD